MKNIAYLIENNPSKEIDKIANFLMKIDNDFVPKLSERIKKLSDTSSFISYAKKLSNKSTRAIAIDKSSNTIIGMIAFYSNDMKNFESYIPIVAVLEEYRGMGVGNQLLKMCIEYLSENRFKKVVIKTWKNNNAINLYKKHGFKIIEETPDNYKLNLIL